MVKIFLILIFLIVSYGQPVLVLKKKFSIDTTKYRGPVYGSSFDFDNNSIVVIVEDKYPKKKVENNYLEMVSKKGLVKKTVLLFDSVKTVKRYGSSGNSRDSFEKATFVNLEKGELIVATPRKIGKWKINSKDKCEIFELKSGLSYPHLVLKDRKVYGSNSEENIVGNSKSYLELNFEPSKYEENCFEEISREGFYDISDIKERLNFSRFYNKQLPMESFFEFLGISPIYGFSLFYFEKEFFYIMNSFGNEIVKMDFDHKVLDRFKIDTIRNLRDLELKNITKKEFRGARRKSILLSFFYDKKRERFIIQFNNSKYLEDLGYPDKSIFIYSIKERGVVEEFSFNISGIINGFDPETGRVSVINQNSNDCFELEIYEL
ncbi:MAG: hypothetical protein CSA15_11660 [Candidatus Delongbacteria bacterium]|nr:MAG: hypothetical protein CSA15_11660 [Candidatus Delongbacteria bacterium]